MCGKCNEHLKRSHCYRGEFICNKGAFPKIAQYWWIKCIMNWYLDSFLRFSFHTNMPNNMKIDINKRLFNMGKYCDLEQSTFQSHTNSQNIFAQIPRYFWAIIVWMRKTKIPWHHSNCINCGIPLTVPFDCWCVGENHIKNCADNFEWNHYIR